MPEEPTDADYVRQREFTRQRLQIAATVEADGHRITGETDELSMNGLFVRCTDHLPQGSPCHVILTLGDEARIEVGARVATVLGHGMGIAFDAMDPDSFAHLKRLVRYNAQDREQVEAELESHLGFKARLTP